MFQIAIFDEEPDTLEEISRMTAEILTELQISHRIARYGNTQALYAALEAGEEQARLFLLDIAAGGAAPGMALAQRLRDDDNEADIIFFSRRPEFAVAGYDVQASGYLLKPVQRNQLQKRLEFVYRRRYQPRYLRVGDFLYEELPLRDILYFETAGRHVSVHSRGARTDIVPGRIRDVLRQLPAETFCQCHQSFIINLDATLRVVRYRAQMVEEVAVPVSKSFYKQVQQRFLRSLERR